MGKLPDDLQIVLDEIYDKAYKAGYHDGERDARKRYEETAIILDIDDAIARGIDLEGLI